MTAAAKVDRAPDGSVCFTVDFATAAGVASVLGAGPAGHELVAAAVDGVHRGAGE